MSSTYALETQATEQLQPIARPRWLPLLFAPATMVGLLSWQMDGATFICDAAFLLLCIGCCIGLILEMRGFSQRFGVGGLTLFGGTLVWYCHDYFNTWFANGYGYTQSVITSTTVAKAMFCTCLFTMLASAGLLITRGRRIENLAARIPEPANPQLYLILAIVCHCIGLVPYFLWAEGNPFVAMLNNITGMRSGEGTRWLIGRTGNLNYSWGGYIVHFSQVGWLGAILAVAYAVFLARDAFSRIVCWLIWLFWMAVNFGSGTRGFVVAVGMPAVFMVFIRYHMQAAALLSKFSLRAYLYTVGAGFVLLVAIQFQGTFRTVTSAAWDIDEVELFKTQGNHMFSEALQAYQMVPDSANHPFVTFTGAGWVRPMPDTVVRFAIGWIPRVIWKDKPGFSEFGAEYNRLISGGTAENTAGATICFSVAGGAYIFYGIPGVLQFGLLFGWLCGLCERIFLNNKGKLIVMLFGLGLITWMFRSFRDLTPHDLYPLLIGIAVFSLFTIPLKAPANRLAPVPS